MATWLRSARFGVRIPAGAIGLSPLQNVQAGSGAHPASYSMSNGASFPGLKRRGSETDYSPLFSKKGKAIPLQAFSGPEGSRKLRFPYFMTMAQDGGKVVSPMHRQPLPSGNTPDTLFG
jgi:hypothetical protein